MIIFIKRYFQLNFMGIFDKFGDTITKTAKTIDKTTKVIAKDLKRRDHDAYLSGMILEKFDVRLLKNLCRYYKVGEPEPTKMNYSTGNVVKERINKTHWIEHAQNKISFANIKDYAQKHQINLNDVKEEEAQLKKERDEHFKV